MSSRKRTPLKKVLQKNTLTKSSMGRPGKSYPMSCDVFVSHAAADKEFAGRVVDMLVTAMGFTAKRIFCTSLEGMKIPPGKDFKTFIKEQIQSPKIVFLLISKNYVESQFCVAEAGASWAMSHTVVPIIIPPATFDDMKGVLAGIQAEQIASPDSWNEILSILRKPLNVHPTTARWELVRDKVIRDINKILQKRRKASGAQSKNDLLAGNGAYVDRSERSAVSQGFAASVLRKLDIFAGDLSWLKEDLEVYKELRKRGVHVRILTDTQNASAIPLGKRIGIEFRTYVGPGSTPLKASISDVDEETESRAFVVKRYTPRTNARNGYDYWIKVYHGASEFAPIKAMAALFDLLFQKGKPL
ncbi:hypothetical protein BH09VER1_BH09VER1_17630 [soil metagenome]